MRSSVSIAVLLWVIVGLFVEWNYAEHRAKQNLQQFIQQHDQNLKRVKRVHAQNLEQAESKFVSCIENRPFDLGESVYVPQTRKTTLTAVSLKGIL